jgi:hypothetical protein
MSLYLPPDAEELLQEVKHAALDERISLYAWIWSAVREKLQAKKKGKRER